MIWHLIPIFYKDLLVNKAVYTLARIDIAEGGGKEIKPLVFEMPPNP